MYDPENHAYEAQSYADGILALEEQSRIITPEEAARARRLNGQEEPEDFDRPRPRKKVYVFSDRTNRPPLPPQKDRELTPRYLHDPLSSEKQ